jgi:hypothetical protein
MLSIKCVLSVVFSHLQMNLVLFVGWYGMNGLDMMCLIYQIVVAIESKYREMPCDHKSEE